MLCPRCQRPMHRHDRPHRDGHVDSTHTCRHHPVWVTFRERRDATLRDVAAMREAVAGDVPFSVSAGLSSGQWKVYHESHGPTPASVGAIRPPASEPLAGRIPDASGEVAYMGGAGPRPNVVRADPPAAWQQGEAATIQAQDVYHGPDAAGIEWAKRMPRDGDMLPNAPTLREQHIAVFRLFARMTRAEAEELIGRGRCTAASRDAIEDLIARELPAIRRPAPPPPRPVRVGDTVRDEDGSLFSVEDFNGRRYIMQPPALVSGHGQRRITPDRLREEGWTHADGAPIAVGEPRLAPERVVGHTVDGTPVVGVCRGRRAVQIGDVLRNPTDTGGIQVTEVWWSPGVGLMVKHSDNGWQFNCPLSHYREGGWTFADTGEPV